MDGRSKATLLLEALDALVRGDEGTSGFAGTVAIGVRTPMGPRWWVVDCGAKAAAAFRDEVPADASVALLLSEVGATRIIEGCGPDEGAAIFGDRRVLGRFVDRYLKKRSFVAIRAAQQGASATAGKKAKSGRRR